MARELFLSLKKGDSVTKLEVTEVVYRSVRSEFHVRFCWRKREANARLARKNRPHRSTGADLVSEFASDCSQDAYRGATYAVSETACDLQRHGFLLINPEKETGLPTTYIRLAKEGRKSGRGKKKDPKGKP